MFIIMAFIITAIFPNTSRQVHGATGITSDFKQLNAAQIVSDMGTGWNLGNQLEATISGTPFETAWGNPVITQSLIQKVKTAGFDTIRIPISYLSKIGSAPNYTIDSAWLARIKEVVDYAYNLDMYVVINIHGDGYHTVDGGWLLPDLSNQTQIREKYQKVWQQVANQFTSYDERLVFESMNEVFDGTYGAPNASYYANLNVFNQIFVDTVRQTGGNNSARWLLVPGWNTNIDYTAGNFGFIIPTDTNRSSTIPSSEKRIMISAHYYSPWDFCGDTSSGITQWGSTATNPSRVSSWGQEDYMEDQMQMMYNKFASQGYPVVIGEYGAIDKSGADSTSNTYRQDFVKKFNAYCKNFGAVPVYWDNGHNGEGGFALFNRSTLTTTQPGIIQAIMEGMNVVLPSNSSISINSATFDKKTSEQSNINVTMTLNGNTLSSIKKGSSTLVAGTDYTVSGNNVTISKNYLAQQDIGTITLTFNFSAGKESILSITVLDSAAATGSLKIQMFNSTTSASSNTIGPKFKLMNTGTSTIDLSNVKIRYYYTIDSDKAQNYTCDWSHVGASNITGSFVKMPVAKTGADYYLEVGFTSGSGSLAAGQNIEIQIRINRGDWSNYTQTGDYSLNATATSYVDWNKVTAYQSGNLIWGIEP